MTEAEQQALEAAVMAHPKMQSALRTLRAWRTADDIGATLLAVMGAMAKHYCATLMNSGQSIDEVNAVLPAFIRDIEAQRQQILSDVRRWLDEPTAPNKLQ